MRQELSLPTHEDVKAVEAVRQLTTEEVLLLSQNLGELLLSYTTEQLESAAERVGALYWKASVASPPFKHEHVDVFGVAALKAMESHTEMDSTTALSATRRLRRARGAATLDKPKITTLHYHGLERLANQ